MISKVSHPFESVNLSQVRPWWFNIGPIRCDQRATLVHTGRQLYHIPSQSLPWHQLGHCCASYAAFKACFPIILFQKKINGTIVYSQVFLKTCILTYILSNVPFIIENLSKKMLFRIPVIHICKAYKNLFIVVFTSW